VSGSRIVNQGRNSFGQGGVNDLYRISFKKGRGVGLEEDSVESIM